MLDTLLAASADSQARVGQDETQRTALIRDDFGTDDDASVNVIDHAFDLLGEIDWLIQERIRLGLI